jgi:hypothetical protein
MSALAILRHSRHGSWLLDPWAFVIPDPARQQNHIDINGRRFKRPIAKEAVFLTRSSQRNGLDLGVGEGAAFEIFR